MDESKDISKGNSNLNYQQSDPTSLTTAALQREIASLKELSFVRIEAIEQSIKIAHEDLVRVPTDVQKQVGALKELIFGKISDMEMLKDEKFRNVDKRFEIIEAARVEQKTDTATAVTNALNAAKEAVKEQNISNTVAITKSEAATTKQIDQQGVLLSTSNANIMIQVNDLKERMGKMEGSGTGKKDMWGYIIGAVGLLATILTIVFTVMRNFH